MQRSTARYAALLALTAAAVACGDSTDPAPEAAFIQLTSAIDVLPAGQSWELQAVVEDEDGDIISNPDVDFSSDDTGIATVNDAGVVTGVGNGIVTITAEVDGLSDEVDIGIFDIGNLCENALGIELGESVRASLQPGDCDEIFNDGTFVDLWFFDLATSQTVTIELESSVFDSYLELIDDQGDLLAFSGDATTDAEITETLSAGTYFLLVNHFPGDHGAYTLTLTGSATAQPAQLAPASLELQKTRAAPTLRARRK